MLKDRLFQGIGELTVQFATLEHRLQQLLELLMGKDNVLIGPLFIHNLSLATLLRKIRIVARYKVRENSRFLYDLERTVRSIDAVREERNLLIHGEWQIKDTETFPVKVRDFRMRYDQSDRQEFTETALTEKKVTRLVRRLKGLGNDVNHLIDELGSSQMAPQVAGEAS
jgi:hypothetical protein